MIEPLTFNRIYPEQLLHFMDDSDAQYPTNRWVILGVMSLSLVIVMLNKVKLNVALPDLSTDLSADHS